MIPHFCDDNPKVAIIPTVFIGQRVKCLGISKKMESMTKGNKSKNVKKITRSLTKPLIK